MRGKRRPTTDRTRALGIAVLEGASEASRQTGIPDRTIRDWMDSEEFAALRERTKDEVAAEWWAIVQKGMRRVGVLLETTDDAQRAATATAIVTDKMLLIRGEATSRTETRSLADDLDDHERAALKAVLTEALAEGETAGSDPGAGLDAGAASTSA